MGEVGYNKFGSKMLITEYRNSQDIGVYFPKYGYTITKNTYSNFKNGTIKCPYEPRIRGIGYLGIGKYECSVNNAHTKFYKAWYNMIRRCYDSIWQIKQPTYIGCTVCEEWYNFQNFAKWYEENYYEIEGQRMCLDKDILCKGNKIYSPDTCLLVPQEINELFVKRDVTRGEYPIGVSYHKTSNKFRASCSNVDKKHIILGDYGNPIDAFNEYKRFKELTIKKVADKYKDLIPEKLYDAMYKYEVEITD